MASTTPFPHRDPVCATRLFGIETEYAFAALDANGERLDTGENVTALMNEAIRQVPHLRCSSGLDVFTANGSRVYLDVGEHPEVATPECSTPEEVVRYTRAGDLLLMRAARQLEHDARPDGAEMVLWKANVDHTTNATWASHESYLHVAPQRLFARHLVTHLVTRIVFTGAGGFDNSGAKPRFVVSPRAVHLKHAVSSDSRRQRGIFHNRDEPLAKEPYRRLHVLAGESLWSETADYLRVGTTALLIAQVDAGRLPQEGLDLVSPVQAITIITRDLTCTARLDLGQAGHLTAIEIQRKLLESVEADLGASHLPSWAPAVCACWRTVLDRLETSPSSLVGVLDWPTKLSILKHQCETQGLEWTFAGNTGVHAGQGVSVGSHSAHEKAIVARLLETDMRFNRLDESGIFTALDQKGALAHRVVEPDTIERAVHQPPSTGRARIRSAYVDLLAGKGSAVSCNWDGIIDEDARLRLDLDDPLQSDGEQWVALPVRATRPFRDSDPRVDLITATFNAGNTPQGLQQILGLITDVDLPSHNTCRSCVGLIANLVPKAPVPRIRPGAEHAERVLIALFDTVRNHADDWLQDQVGTLLYRLNEAKGQYMAAARVIEKMLARANEQGSHNDIAVLTNNLGYEYLIDEQWETAEPLFERAIGLFEQAGDSGEIASVRANLLECRFGRLDPSEWSTLIPTLTETNRQLVTTGDWRARKTLRLLARLAAQRGRLPAARAWARKAVAASGRTRTQLRDWDRRFLVSLRNR